MAIVCALTGVTPEEPVFSPTGFVFEKRAIEKHLKTAGKCPISDRDLDVTELQPIIVPRIAKPRPPSATSIPGLLMMFQSEWDATMAETFTLRQHVDQVRNQLSQTLYQHDASCRVIARLLREKNAALGRSAQLQKRLTELEASTGGAAFDAEPGLSEEDFQNVSELSIQLPKDRKKRSRAAPYDQDVFASFACIDSLPLHQTTAPGVTCCTMDVKANSSLIATGGVDGFVVLFDVKQKRTKSRLIGHMKRVNRVEMHRTEPIVLSASDDKTCRVWRQIDDETNEHTCAHTIRRHFGAVNDLHIHPVGTFFASCGKDNSWSLHDLQSGRTLTSQQDLPANYHCMRFHPDGALLSGGDETGTLDIWDMKSKKPDKKIISLSEHRMPITCIDFAENGIYAASGSLDGTIRLWDLRKPVVMQTLTLEKESKPFNCVAYDSSANYIVAGCGNDVVLYSTPPKALASEVTILKQHTATVTDVCFGPDASFFVSTSLDRMVKIWEPEVTVMAE